MERVLLLSIALLSTISIYAEIRIKGTVKDQFGELQNANVFIKGTNKGTITNTKGYFEFEVDKYDIIAVSYLGYQTQEFTIINDNSIHVVLEGSVSLDEVELIAFGATTTCTSTIGCAFSCSTKCSTVVNYSENEELLDDNIIIFPNPSLDGLFRLNFNQMHEELKVQITTVSGKKIQSISYEEIKTLTIDLSKFPTGIYIISGVLNGERKFTKKVVRI